MVLRAKDDDTLIHEPRALWTIVRQEAPASDADILSGRVLVPKDHFRNVSRYPITLTRMLVSAIGYTYREFEDAVVNLTDVHNSMIAGTLIDIAVAAPYSVHWGRVDFRAASLPPCPFNEPGFITEKTNGGLEFGQIYASGLWGLSRWEFDKLLWLPRSATIQFDLSPAPLPNIGAISFSDAAVQSMITFDEPQTGIFGGNNRQSPYAQRRFAQGNRLAEMGLPAADAFGAVALGAQGDAETWPASGRFQGKIFNRQETNRGQDRNAFSAFNVMIDQIDYDEEIQTLVAPFPGQPLAPLSTRMVCRAKCSNGGTNEWWWRPGAPLCLVAPTIGPAISYKLPVPIVLGPGEELEVEVQMPVGPLIAPSGSSTPELWQPTYQIGLSFTGSASIEM